MAKKKSAAHPNPSSSAMFIERAADVVPDVDDETSSIDSLESLEHHPEFFFDNTLIAIQVGKTLFNVHKYQLSKSEVFSERFKRPKPEGDEPEEGSSPAHPIKLRGVSPSDFAALLRVLYASHFSSNQPAPEAPLIIPAFRLANKFKFADLRAFLLPLAEKNLNDVDKIVFAREFDIKEWLVPAHVRLCQREERLSVEEARKLQVDSVLMVSHMREQYRTRETGGTLTVNHIYCQDCTGMAHYSDMTRTCQHCDRSFKSHFMQYTRPGTMWGKAATTNDTALEEEVRKWVEDNYVSKGR